MPAKKKPAAKAEESATGTYVYDKTLGKVVKVSGDIPGLNKSGAHGGHECGGNCGCAASGRKPENCCGGGCRGE